MTYYLRLYAATLVAFFAVDIVWLGLVAARLYRAQLGHLMAARTNWLAAAIFYLLYILGILIFAVLPGLQAHSLRTTLWRAALFGLIAYATYDLTNLATLRDWPLTLTVIDMAWGATLTTIVALVAHSVDRWLH